MKSMNKQLQVKGVEVSFIQTNQEDFISITDIAKFKNPWAPGDIIKNWMRAKNTIALLGLWEKLHNPDFKLVEFDQFKNEAGYNHFVLSPQQISHVYANEADVLNMALFGKTARQWREENPEEQGNIRDFANVSQLVCLANLENLNAVFICDGISQSERLSKLNRIAIGQMRILLQSDESFSHLT